MKKFVFFFVMLLTAFFSFAQSVQVTKSQKSVGDNLKANNELIADVFIFPERIENFTIDSANNKVTLSLRNLSKNGKYLQNKGQIVLYDLNQEKALWKKDINFMNNNFTVLNNNNFFTTGYKTSKLKSNDGTEEWQLPNSIYFANNDVALGYKYKIINSNFSDNLEGINLTDGKVLWSKEIKKNFGWNDVKKLNDSTILITSSGLHQINVNTGEGWSYEASTGRNDYKGTIAANIIGIALMATTGSGFYSYGKDVVRELVSNTLYNDSESAVYLASRDKLVKLNISGEKLWEKELEKNQAAKSLLFEKENDLLMINLGYAYFNENLIDHGTPYIALYDKHTGEQKYMKTVAEKKDMIRCMQMNDDRSTIILSFDNKIAKYNLTDGSLIKEIIYDSKKYGKPNKFIGTIHFEQTANGFESLKKLYPDKNILITEKDFVLFLNDDLSIAKETKPDDYAFTFLEKENLQLIVDKEKNIHVTDGNLEERAILRISPAAQMVGNKIYDKNENELVVIDLNNL